MIFTHSGRPCMRLTEYVSGPDAIQVSYGPTERAEQRRTPARRGAAISDGSSEQPDTDDNLRVLEDPSSGSEPGQDGSETSESAHAWTSESESSSEDEIEPEEVIMSTPGWTASGWRRAITEMFEVP